jgi:hypothetical protein
MAPTLFYAACMFLAVAGLWWRLPIAALFLPIIYAAALLLAGAATFPRNGARVAACVPVAIATLHAGYAWGFAYGLWAKLFVPGAWDSRGKMSTISR